MPTKSKPKSGSTLDKYFGYALRIVGVIGDNKSPALPPADNVIRADALEKLSSGDPLVRFDLVVWNQGAEIDPKSAQQLALITHEIGCVYLAVPNKNSETTLRQTGFATTIVANLWQKPDQTSPEEYDESYIDRWGDTDFLANSELASSQILAHTPKGLDKTSLRVLDVGCLNGYIMESVYQAGVEHIYGTDISFSLAISHGLSKHHLPAITIGDFSQNTYPDGVANMTICMEVLEHIPPTLTDKFVEELARVTGSDGILLISTSEDPNADPTHINCRKRAEWYYIFSQHGLVATGSQIIFPGFNSFVVRKTRSDMELKLARLQASLWFSVQKLLGRARIAEAKAE
jgi:2-polyprenyl-3-methyl-5-hydroxy-6-metoxy-1,4-benzoquinol methylase